MAREEIELDKATFCHRFSQKNVFVSTRGDGFGKQAGSNLEPGPCDGCRWFSKDRFGRRFCDSAWWSG